MREARLSLRARLAESDELETAAPVVPPAPARPSQPRPSADPLREQVEEARRRVHARARAADFEAGEG
jgi:hypothetical protein